MAKDNIYDNILMLGSCLQGDIPALLNNLKDARVQFEQVLAKLKEKENEYLAQKAEQERLQAEALEKEQAAAEETVEAVEEDLPQEAQETPQSAEPETVLSETEPEPQTQEMAEAPRAEEKKPPKPERTDRPERKIKSSEEKFLQSLPKPVENKRFIDISPKSEAPSGVRRYTAPEDSGRPRRPEQQPPRKFVRPGTGPVKIEPVVNVDFSAKPGAKTVKKKGEKGFDADKKEKTATKRTLIRRAFETDTTLLGDDYSKMGSKKYKTKKKDLPKQMQKIAIEKATVSTEIIPIKILSDKLGIPAVEITKRLFKDGIIKTINETIDYETAALLAVDMGIELELKLEQTAEDKLTQFHEEQIEEAELKKRPPIVTVMGHVDHGKTSLLDAIKNTNVAEGEAGGITQQIGAYSVKVRNEHITFIDTPGHEAFTAMRARGASITDIAVLVVAADDGIMPQTIEAINHAKAADVPIIVAVNKMDKPAANPDRIKQQLTEYGLVPEEWGGDTMVCPVSAVKNQGIEKLLDAILLLADIKELKANPSSSAKGAILEAKLDKGKGPVATVLVQNGTLKIGDTVVAGVCIGKIRAMIDDKGGNVKEAGPSIAVSVLGFSEVPSAGDLVFAMENEKLAKRVADERLAKIKTEMTKTSGMVTLDDVFEKIAEGQIKGLNIVLKADLQGSVEAVGQALEKLSTAEVKVNIIHSGVGAINESDIRLAQTAAAIIIGFSVRPELKAKQLAERENVDIRLYRIIYDVTDDVEKALKGMLEPKYKETQLGQAEVRNVFKISGAGTVAGCYVINGKILRNAKVRLIRDGIVIAESTIASLKRFKDDAKEVAQGFECGIAIENYNDIKESDIIECFAMEEITE